MKATRNVVVPPGPKGNEAEVWGSPFSLRSGFLATPGDLVALARLAGRIFKRVVDRPRELSIAAGTAGGEKLAGSRPGNMKANRNVVVLHGPKGNEAEVWGSPFRLRSGFLATPGDLVALARFAGRIFKRVVDGPRELSIAVGTAGGEKLAGSRPGNMKATRNVVVLHGPKGNEAEMWGSPFRLRSGFLATPGDLVALARLVGRIFKRVVDGPREFSIAVGTAGGEGLAGSRPGNILIYDRSLYK